MTTENKLYTFRSMLEEGIDVKDKETGEVTVRKIGKIIIPMIQRPYAQGRKSQKSIREKFLGDIFSALTDSNTKKLELNFLYGTFVKGNDGEDSNTFELLDGQQRMTTLFLLHWYLANIKMDSDNNFNMPEYMSKFTYQTRTSSSDFIEKLVSKKVVLNDKPSRCIRGSIWYSKSFDKDTTIDSMLRMLDSIDEFYKKSDVKPHYEDLEKLQFYVLELNGFGLSEELFIKMNARGLQLTPFENFKADLIGYMKKQKRYTHLVTLPGSKINREVPYWMGYSSLMDSRWQDLFWTRPEKGDHENSGSKESDIRFFRFIQRYLSNKMITLDTESKNLRQQELFRFFADNIEVERHDNFVPYEKIIDYALSLPDKQDIIVELAKVLNFLTDKKIGKTIIEGLKPSWDSELTWKPWGTVGTSKFDVGQRNMILMSAMTEFIEKFNSVEDFNLKAYKQWMRVVNNLVVNWDVSGEEYQIQLTRLLKEWLEYNDDGNSLNTWSAPYQTLIAYTNSRKRPNQYLKAECIKASKILKDESWEEAFINAESNSFLTGSVTFYYEEDMDLQTYTNRTSKVPLLFDENGVVHDFRENFTLIRAVLCRNYDWSNIRKEATNFTVTNDYSPTSRYLKVLTIWNDATPVKQLFCQLLDCNSEEEMKEVVNKVSDEEHNLILKDSLWKDEQAKANLQKGYDNLCKTSDMNALAWLYNTEKSMSVYISRNGTVMLYKGPVNSLLLSTNRNQIITEVIKSSEEKFQFQFIDHRQVDNFRKYGAYSGDTVGIKSTEGKIPNGLKLYLYFRSDDRLRFTIPRDEKFAEEIYEHFKDKDTGSTLQNGERKFFTWDGIAYYQALEISGYESMGSKGVLNMIDEIYQLAKK